MNKLLLIICLSFFVFSVNAQSFDAIGIAHNEVVKQILPQLIPSHGEGNVFRNIRNLTPDCFDGIPVADTTKYFSLVSFGDPNLLLNEFVAVGLMTDRNLTSEIRKYFVLTKNKTVSDVLEIVENGRNNTNDQRLLEFLSVMKHSAMFWGNGEYVNYLPPGGEEVIVGLSSFWKAMLCDAVGTVCSGGNGIVGGVCSVCSAINSID